MVRSAFRPRSVVVLLEQRLGPNGLVAADLVTMCQVPECIMAMDHCGGNISMRWVTAMLLII